MKEKICQYLSGIVEGISAEEFWEWMEVPPEEKMGDLALPCYGLAKKLRQNPKLIAAEIAEKLNDLRDTEKVRKTSGAEIFRKLQAEGYVSEQYIDGTRKKVVSEKGKEAGLFIDMRMSKKGTEYEDVYYNEKAQEMIVNMLTGKE